MLLDLRSSSSVIASSLLHCSTRLRQASTVGRDDQRAVGLEAQSYPVLDARAHEAFRRTRVAWRGRVVVIAAACDLVGGVPFRIERGDAGDLALFSEQL